MAGVPEVVKGYFKYSVAGSVLTVTAMGVTKVRFPKFGVLGDFVTLDLTGKVFTTTWTNSLVNMRHGITAANAWASKTPLFNYLVNTANTAAGVYLMHSRRRGLLVSGADAANISDNVALATTDDQTTLYVDGAAAVGTACAASPLVCIGSIGATYVAATRWIPSALAATDGFGQFQDTVWSTMPIAQMGAAAARYFTGAGSPVFAVNVFLFNQGPDGSVSISMNLAQCTAGVGANQTVLALPFVSANTLTHVGLNVEMFYAGVQTYPHKMLTANTSVLPLAVRDRVAAYTFTPANVYDNAWQTAAGEYVAIEGKYPIL